MCRPNRAPPSSSSSTTSTSCGRAVTRLHVLDFGRTIASGTCAEVLRDEAVITAYLGVAAT